MGMLKDPMRHWLEALLSVKEAGDLEPYAQTARALSLQHHGKAVVLYTPLYLSNACVNGCLYCNFSVEHAIKRRVLSPEEALEEALHIKAEGIRHLLLLSGEDEQALPFETFCQIAQLLMPHFSSIAVETYALTEQAYAQLASIGVIGVTLYQETYDHQRYTQLHPFGPKADYAFRHQAPARVAKSGIRQMNLGILMGLSHYKEDVIALIRHGKALERCFPDLELSFSLPRLILDDPRMADRLGLSLVDDLDFVKSLIALRLAFPRAVLNCSTRESLGMRRALIPLGVNKLSASVSTAVGGRLKNQCQPVGEQQFQISDDSNLNTICQLLRDLGYMPVLSDWHTF